MVAVAVIDPAARRIRRENDQRNARAVAKVVDWLHESRVIVAAGFVPGDEDGSFSLEFRIGLERIENLLPIGFEQVQLRTLRMSVEVAVRLGEGNRGERILLD